MESSIASARGPGFVGARVLRFLDEHPGVPTWKLETGALVALEIACHVAVALAAPDLWTAAVLVAAAVPAIFEAVRQQTARSAAARRREEAAAAGIVLPRLHCEADVERDAARSQLHASLSPLFVLAAGVAASRGRVSAPLVVAALACAARVAWGRGYVLWRAWMRRHRPARRTRGY